SVKTADLAAANFLTLKSRVTPGQQLIIPRAPTTLLAARTDTIVTAAVDNDAKPAAAKAVAAENKPAVAEKKSAVEKPDAKPAVKVTPASARLEPQKVTYRVKRGDTLTSIAKLYNTTIADLKSWNKHVIVGNRIQVGDRLTILTTRPRASTN